MKNKKQLGFTMIELIVVVTIMALLTVIAMVSYSTTGTKSRDSKRMADLEKVRVALELYRQEKGFYPLSYALLSPTYLQEWPKDPKNSTYYYERDYLGVGSSYTYAVYGRMEDVGSTNGSYASNCNGVCNYRLISP
jgi:prepilin-type N-terminal cleavage/methylation domain-containing protein